MTPEFDKLYEGLWDNINKAKKRGKTSSKWKNDPKYRARAVRSNYCRVL